MSTIELLVKQDEIRRPYAMMVYMFLCYTRAWQKTNQPKATTDYIVKGTSICRASVIEAKKYLMEIGLIEDVITRDELNRIAGHFIRVNMHPKRPTQPDFSPEGKKDTILSKIHTVEKRHPNAYRTTNKTVGNKKTIPDGVLFSTSNDKNTNTKTSWERCCVTTFVKALNKHRKIHGQIKALVWAKEFALLRKGSSLSKKEIIEVLRWYCKNIDGEFVPTAYCAHSFRQKFSGIVRAKEIADGGAAKRSGGWDDGGTRIVQEDENSATIEYRD